MGNITGKEELASWHNCVMWFIISEYADLRGKRAQTNLVPPALSALAGDYDSFIPPAKQLSTFRKSSGKYNF